ncbi:MAG: polyhydroxybutyrate depolymerase [Hyphomicrobiales bacterium]|nr:polyhydroxybutyrate depolymerase [Hyphomicrobiales bacterium]
MLRVVPLRALAALLAILATAPLRAAEATPCGPEGRCTIDGGEYRILLPPGWDGAAPLPVLLHFHGYRENAAEIVAREDLRAFTARRGVLLVVPEGLGGTWSHPGSPAQARDELAFVDRIRADLARRLPVDPRRVLVSGFSQGAAMVWNLACHRGHDDAAFLAIAGTFWLPQPGRCPAGAQRLVQIHGVADRVVPLEGRAIRGRFHQGDVFRAMAMMRDANRCGPETSRTRRAGALVCDIMTGCASGRDLALCLHPGGHDFDAAWLDFAWNLINRDEGR